MVVSGIDAPPPGRGTEDEPAARSSTDYVGTVSLASKVRTSVPGPGAFPRRRGRLFRVSRERT
jgi:hypothetical protein